MQIADRLNVVAESITLAVTAQANALKKQGIDVVSFGAGEPDFDTPEPIKDAAIAALKAGKTKYEPTSGTPEARTAIADKLSRYNHLDYSPEEIIISVGGKHSLYVAMMATLNPGDEVIIPAPYWVSYPEMVKLAGGTPVFLRGEPARDFKLTPQQLAAAITPRTRMLIMNSPSNPGGHTYHRQELHELSHVLDRHPQIIVCSDEIYERLVFNGQKSCSWAALNWDLWKSRTITCNCLSKTYAMTGWRIGYTAGPRELIAAMNKLQSQMTSNITSFCMPAIVNALSDPANEAAVEKMRLAFEERGEHMWRRLNAIDGIRCVRPTGAFYCFADIKGLLNRPLGPSAAVCRDAVEFARRLLADAHVAVVPGNDFGFDDHVRLSFATGMEQINRGLDRIQEWVTGGAGR